MKAGVTRVINIADDFRQGAVKIEKYRELVIKIHRICKTRASVVHLMVDALGAIYQTQKAEQQAANCFVGIHKQHQKGDIYLNLMVLGR